MHTPLLTTKLYMPRYRPGLVSRPRLLKRLNEGLGQGTSLSQGHFARKLTLLSAPAGFGKTTLAVEWLSELQTEILDSRARKPAHKRRRVAWLSLDKGDNDPVRFLRYLVAALQMVDEDIGVAVQGLLGSPQFPGQAALTLLINDIAAAPGPFVLVLDDYHSIHLESVQRAVEYLVEHMPPQMHLVLTTRQDPPLPLSRLRVRGQMTEIGQDDLRFTTGEAAAFLEKSLGLCLEPQAVAMLEARTEGWIAGLQLATLALQGTIAQQVQPAEGIDTFIEAFSGSHRDVIDYLADEVLAQQPAEIRQFLRQTAILERLTAPLCNTLTGQDNAAVLLRQLEEAHLFMVPLDDRRMWYRYHRLFASFLRTELDPAEAAELHHRAARWFAAHDLLPEAANHALAAGDVDEAARIIALAAEGAFRSASFTTLEGWLAALPEQTVQSHGELATYRGLIAFLTGAFPEADAYARAAERCFPPGQPSPSQGRMLCLRAHVTLSKAAFAEATRLAQEAIVSLAQDDLLFQSLTLNALGQALEWQGQLEMAAEVYRQGALTGQHAGDQIGALAALINLLFSLNALGRRREALSLCRQVVADTPPQPNRALSLVEGVNLAWSLLSYEGNELERARDQLLQVLPRCEEANLADALLVGQYILGLLHLAEREVEALREITSRARRQATRLQLDAVHGARFADLEARACLAEGDLEGAANWIERARQAAPHASHHWLDNLTLTQVRLLLAQGRHAEAQRVLASLQDRAQQGKWRRTLISVHLQSALAHHAQGRTDQAHQSLQEALHLAAPEGYQRAFLDEGPTLAGLLPATRPAAPAFVDEVLAAFAQKGSVPAPRASSHAHMIDPLSERELEILRLVAAGRSNPEIAEMLYLSTNTVKWHLKNIYGKLQVKNRVEAAARGQELDLL